MDSLQDVRPDHVSHIRMVTEQTPPTKARWRPRFSLRSLMISVICFGLLYTGLWALTGAMGSRGLEDYFHIDQGYVQVEPDGPGSYIWPKERGPRPRQWYYIETMAIAPFVLRVDHGILRGHCDGYGARSYVFWFFGPRKTLKQELIWVS